MANHLFIVCQIKLCLMVTDITKNERVAFRLDSELLKKLEVICNTENKKLSSVAYDACMIYAELYPFMHALKSQKLYSKLALNEEVIKEEIFTAVKKLI